jgi:hypothetical protein
MCSRTAQWNFEPVATLDSPVNPITRTAVLRAGAITLVMFALYLLTHTPALDEMDSVQFAMGVRSFDILKHQPHPPGYPLFILAAWLGTQLFRVTPELSLYIISALGGGLFVGVWFLIIRQQFSETLAWWVAPCLAITPIVWMTATKALTDAPAAALISAEVLAGICCSRRLTISGVISTALLGAAATGVRPQLVLVALVILATALNKSGAKLRLSGLMIFVLGCMLWLVPTSILQGRLNNDVPTWRVFFDLAYSQWRWRLDQPDAYLGAGDWSGGYLWNRFFDHIISWFNFGFGFHDSRPAAVVGVTIASIGAIAYASRKSDDRDASFWKFHTPWALTHIAIIFVCLPPWTRYYLIVFPLLLVVWFRGILQLPHRWSWLALALPAFLLSVTIPNVIQNHREEAPPVRLVRYLEQLYPPGTRASVVLLLPSTKRQAEWYAPEFTTIQDIPGPEQLDQVVANASAIYVDDGQLALPKSWHRLLIAKFWRSRVIYQKQNFAQLFRIQRDDDQ